MTNKFSITLNGINVYWIDLNKKNEKVRCYFVFILYFQIYTYNEMFHKASNAVNLQLDDFCKRFIAGFKKIQA